MSKADALLEKVGLSLGPIGMTLGESKSPGSASPDAEPSSETESTGDSLVNKAGKMMDDAGVSLGPIGMTLGGGDANSGVAAKAAAQSSSSGATSSSERGSNKSIASLSTEEWRKKFVNPDGTVDLFMKDDFNAASRLAGAAEFDTMTNIENVAWNGLPSDAIKTRH
jgi:ferredoxin